MFLHKLHSLSTNPSPVAKWLERQGLFVLDLFFYKIIFLFLIGG